MRKVYVLSLLMIVMAGGAFAQRNIDWSVDAINGPTQLNSDASSGTAIALDVIFKNNGADTAFVGDSVFYNLAVTNRQQTQGILAYPSASGYAFFELTRNVNPGDTIQVKRDLSTTLYLTVSADVRVVITSLIVNRDPANLIATEVAPGNANNQVFSDITWWNPQGWGVSVDEVATSDMINIFPNPAKTEVNVEWNISNSERSTTVRILDLNGRVVAEQDQTAQAFGKSIDVSALESGMYMVEVSNGVLTTTKKLQILK